MLSSLTARTSGNRTGPLTWNEAALRDPALVAQEDWIDHGTLRRRVEALVARLPDPVHGRLLAHVRLRPTVDDVVAYLAVLEAGHVALLLPPGRNEALESTWPADMVVEDGRVTVVGGDDPSPTYLLHPDLALLLSTSGSTGSPKLVRLSHENLAANARGIAAALGLTREDRGVTSLPLHYCFGLSVLHSHLAVGGSVALTGGSVLDESFWDVVDDGVTNLAVVPHMMELMETTGVLARPHHSLRLITQAGGRLSPERVERAVGLGARHGWGLAVMYGQSEATARICVQSAQRTAKSPGTVGLPLPGTSIHLDTDVPDADPATGSGEITVRGPGVMLGYAEHPDDLALGRMVTELRTGDMGVLEDDGSLRIVGRRAGFVKVLGLRIDLARVEATLEAQGLVVCVTGDDDGLRVAVEPVPGESTAGTAARARRTAALACGLDAGHVLVGIAPLARLSNGKVDRAGCAALATGLGHRDDEPRPGNGTPGIPMRAATVLRGVLGRDDVDLGLSFVAQGGDSLSHVQASTRLSEVLGDLPPDWHHRPVRDLIASAAPRRRTWPAVETSVLLRALAVAMICGTHARLFVLPGGAHTLMAVAGFSAALFGLSANSVRERWQGTARFLIGVGVPTMVVAAVGMAVGRYGWGNVLLANWAFGDWDVARHNEFWFVDALLLCVLVAAAVLSFGPIARLWAMDPWRVALAMALAALVPRYVILTMFEGTLRGLMPTVFWLFAVGLAVAHARTRTQRLITLAVAAVGAFDFYPDSPGRNATIFAGILALTLLRNVPVPRWLVPPVTLLASASLHIYLVQFLVLDRIHSAVVGVPAALAVGVLLWRLTAGPVARLQNLVTGGRRRTDCPRQPSRPERTHP